MGYQLCDLGLELFKPKVLRAVQYCLQEKVCAGTLTLILKVLVSAWWLHCTPAFSHPAHISEGGSNKRALFSLLDPLAENVTQEQEASD